MKLNKLIVLFASVFISEVFTLNILGIFPYEGKSHFFVFKPYLEELAKRGNNLTVISYFPRKEPLENYRDISLAEKSIILEDVMTPLSSYWGVIQIFLFINTMGSQNCDVLLGVEGVQKLWKTEAKFDLVLTEQFNSDCALGLAYKLGAPVVGMTSHALLPWHYERLGMQNNPSYVSTIFLVGGTKPTFYQRIERFMILKIGKLLYTYLAQRSNQITLAQYFDDIPPLEELGKDIKFMLVYTNFVLNGAELYPPNVIEVGGFHIAKPKKLPDDLRKFIEESEHGVLYVSFGSMIRASSLAKENFQAILGALSKLPQRIIWKWEEETMPGATQNIYLSKWLPQNDILAHPNVKGFYSHCGLLGVNEAAYHAVPILCMPMFGDQPGNSAVVEENGFGTLINLKDLTTETLLKKLETILSPQFRAKVKELSKIWHDRPISPMDSAIYWTEFAARTSNYTFRSAASTVPVYQYYYLDLIATFIVFILVVILVIKSLCACGAPKQNKKKIKTK